MHTDMATVLPLPQHRDERTERPARSDVRLVMTRRGRMLLTAIAFLLGLAVAAAALVVFGIPAALAGGADDDAVTVTVQEGDTLWGYAEEYAPEGMSPHEFVVEARTVNQLPTGRVSVGQELEMPVFDGASR